MCDVLHIKELMKKTEAEGMASCQMLLIIDYWILKCRIRWRLYKSSFIKNNGKNQLEIC